MLYPRIIPVLLVRDKGLVKTVKFKNHKYVGDPINTVRLFNEKNADEIVVLDIDATVKGKEPDYQMIETLALECRMPLCYGGGIKTIEQAKKIQSMGVEKVALSSSALGNPEMLKDLSGQIGAQSVVVILDVKKKKIGNKYFCYTHNGQKNTKISPFEFAKKVAGLGVGEIIINSIDNDGLMQGYDLNVIHKIMSQVSIPITALGGAGSYDDISDLICQEGVVGAAAGSLFVFKGRYRAVLVNYPNSYEKSKIFEKGKFPKFVNR